jgi:hypothetical protein
MTEDELELKRARNRAYAKKHYEMHKAEIQQSKKDKYHQVLANIPDLPKAPIKPPTSNDMLLERLISMDLNPNTKKAYVGSFHRLVELVGGELLPIFKKGARELITTIDNSEFATSTKRMLIQTVLFLITNLKIVVNKPSLTIMKTYFDGLKVKSNDELHAKMLSDEVPTWVEYLAKSKAEFGVESKEFILANLYQELTLRDDFVLRIVSKLPKTKDENYLVTSGKNYTIVITSYKTDSAYGIIKHKLSKKMTDMLRGLIESRGLVENEYVFGDKKLSPFISAANKQLGYDGGVNLFRHISVSETLTKAPSVEERVKLADKMKHSPFTQIKYLRNLV